MGADRPRGSRADRDPIWALTVESFAGPELAVTTPRGLWVALYYYAFLALFMLAAATPHRRLTSR